jgi:hypothetical protein
MIGIDIGELIQGCDQGLLGRVYSLSVALLADDSERALDNCILQVERGHLESAIQKYINIDEPYHSSHAPVYAKQLNNYLGIARLANESQVTYNQLSTSAKNMLRYFLQKNTTTAIYCEAKKFFENAFWVLTLDINNEENNQKMYALLKDLGFGLDENELDKKYRIQGQRENPWQYAFIEQDLPKYLPNCLIRRQLIARTSTEIFSGELFFQKSGEDRNKLLEAAPLAYQHQAYNQQPAVQLPQRNVHVPAPVYFND